MSADDNKRASSEYEATVVISATGVGLTSPAPSGQEPRAIRIGDVLNHMFEVRRFIARGGMGEVFEGVNIASDERVAIKVMLPGRSNDDDKLLALFRKEARTLTRLNHPALVQYRVLAQEPQLGVFYIVTDFVEGRNLSDVIGQLNPTVPDLVQFARRLASALDTAHTLGAIHRDLSPDNVMLDGDVLAGARIIDFGIAKDLNATAATIIGDGFAGKLNYVAPEQLGDFDRSIGPWTDVYSLGLVVLAVATGRHVDMGGTLVSAVDKRRAGADLSAAPTELRPLLARMLRPNPVDRCRSMGEVLDSLAEIEANGAIASEPAFPEPAPFEPIAAEPAPPPVTEARAVPMPPPISDEPGRIEQSAEPPAAPPSTWDDIPEIEAIPAPSFAVPAEAEPQPDPAPPPVAAPAAPVYAPPPPAPPSASTAPVATAAGNRQLPVLLGIGAVLLIAVVALGYFLFLAPRHDETLAADTAKVVQAKPRADLGAIRAALTAGVPAIGCAWLDVAAVESQGPGAVTRLRGSAGNPAEVQKQVSALLAAKNLKGATVDVSAVAPLAGSECALLDALRQLRDPAGQRMTTSQQRVEMTKRTDGAYAGALGATALADFDLSTPGDDLALFGIEATGKVTRLTSGRTELIGASDDLGNGHYRLPLEVREPGWSGLIAIRGQKPFEGAIMSGPAESRTGDWSERFLAKAREHGWKADMVWFESRDEQPN